MVAYLTDNSLATVTRRERLSELGGYNIFSTPAHDWIHDCIRDWTPDLTREWDSALNMSALWPNHRQWIISMLRVGRWAGFASRAKLRRKNESGNPGLVPKGTILVFPSFPVFFGPRFDSLLGLDVLTVFYLEGAKNTGYTILYYIILYYIILYYIILYYIILYYISFSPNIYGWYFH